MANNPTDTFEKQIDETGNALKNDLLAGVEPERLGWLANKLTANGSCTLMPPSGGSLSLGKNEFAMATRNPYLKSVSKITGEHRYRNGLDDSYLLGRIILQYTELIRELERVDRQDVDPGEILGRYVARSVQRNSQEGESLSGADFRGDTRQSYELVEQILAHPSLANSVRSALPNSANAASLVDELGRVELTTPL